MVEGISIREAARTFGLHRDTVRKMLEYPVPAWYRRQTPARRPKLEPYTGVVDQILEKDHSAPKKQRHTAKRIFERLRDEYGFDGGYTTVKDYVREHRCQTREMFVPLSHAPGHAQCDFGEALVVIGGVEQKAHYFILDLPHSDGCFIKAYPAETTEAFLDGHVSAFAFLGGVPQSILYDNSKLAVVRNLGDGLRERPLGLRQLQTHSPLIKSSHAGLAYTDYRWVLGSTGTRIDHRIRKPPVPRPRQSLARNPYRAIMDRPQHPHEYHKPRQ